MPHTWIGAICANFIRSMFVYERDDTLYIASGIDNKWLDEGPIEIKNLPTYYGTLSYSMNKSLNKFMTFIFRKKRYKITCKITGDINAPKDLVLSIPTDGEVLSAAVNGRRVEANEEKQIKIENVPANIVIYTQE
jgi:hypothetical protein